jgi:hypothetical protein
MKVPVVAGSIPSVADPLRNSRNLAHPVTESSHLLRRTARKRQRELERQHPSQNYRVESSMRGPFGWRVVRTR